MGRRLVLDKEEFREQDRTNRHLTCCQHRPRCWRPCSVKANRTLTFVRRQHLLPAGSASHGVQIWVPRWTSPEQMQVKATKRRLMNQSTPFRISVVGNDSMPSAADRIACRCLAEFPSSGTFDARTTYGTVVAGQLCRFLSPLPHVCLSRPTSRPIPIRT
jgi:hypothetical protein